VSDGPASDLIRKVADGDRRALARLISAFEDLNLTVSLPPEGDGGPRSALVVGLTGPPGAGKSSLTSALIGHARSLGLRVGVLAVDPSSPRTGGALLGDRVRMARHTDDREVFIRGLASRGRTGGLADVLPDASFALELWGADVIFIETVGVGQSATEVATAADVTLLVLTVGGGDDIQAAKAGVLELADVVVVNKADLPGARALASSLRGTLRLHHSAARVVCASALDGTGVPELWSQLRSPGDAAKAGRRTVAARRRVAVAVGDEITRLIADGALDVDGTVAACLRGEVPLGEVVCRFVGRLYAGPSSAPAELS
jgi:LAO/AO transport system kinase